MGIFDIFSTSFLFSIAIILLICGGMFTYFSYKIDNQNHKLTSMVNLVSVLAEDLQFVKNQLNKNVNKIQTIHKVNSDLISVCLHKLSILPICLNSSINLNFFIS